METFFAIVLMIVFVPLIVWGYRFGRYLSVRRDERRRERYIESLIFNQRANQEALRRVKQRRGYE